MPDFVPANDSQFLGWLENFHTYVSDNLAALGLAAADLTPVTDAKAAFDAVLPSHVQTQAAARALTAQKDALRDTAEESARVLARKLRANPAVTLAQRNSAGIVAPATPVADPLQLNAPVAFVDLSERLRHVLKIADSSTPASRARPRGAIGCELWRKVGGPAPLGVEECVPVLTATRSPVLLEYGSEDGNKTVHYLLRWVGKDGSKGPWSETISASVAA